MSSWTSSSRIVSMSSPAAHKIFSASPPPPHSWRTAPKVSARGPRRRNAGRGGRRSAAATTRVPPADRTWSTPAARAARGSSSRFGRSTGALLSVDRLSIHRDDQRHLARGLRSVSLVAAPVAHCLHVINRRRPSPTQPEHRRPSLVLSSSAHLAPSLGSPCPTARAGLAGREDLATARPPRRPGELRCCQGLATDKVSLRRQDRSPRTPCASTRSINLQLAASATAAETTVAAFLLHSGASYLTT